MPFGTNMLMGIDIGSTNVKCALYNTNAELKYLVSKPTIEAYKLGTDMNPDILFKIICDICMETVAKARQDGPVQIHGIAISAIGCSVVLLDREGNVLSADASMENRMRSFAASAGQYDPTEFFSITGYPYDFTSGNFLFASLNEDVKSKMAYVVSIGDYIGYRLTGAVVRDFSNAASMATWDHKNDDWWTEFLNKYGIDVKAFGKPVDSGKPIGRLKRDVAQAIDLPCDTMVYTGGHDYLCAALACNMADGKEVLNVAGTVEIMASFYENWINRPDPGQVRSMSDFHVIPGKYSFMIEALGAGQVEWLRSGIFAHPGREDGGIPDLEPYFEGLKAMPAPYGATREIFIPQTYGRMIPKSDMRLTGAYLGLSRMTSSMSLFRATIEGICFQARQLFDRQKEVLGLAEVKYKLVGGGSRNPIWSQIKADILGTAIYLPRIKEASALGAALLAGVGAGIYSSCEEAGKVAYSIGEDIIEPSPDTSGMYQEVYKEVFLPAIDMLEQNDMRLLSVIKKRQISK